MPRPDGHGEQEGSRRPTLGHFHQVLDREGSAGVGVRHEQLQLVPGQGEVALGGAVQALTIVGPFDATGAGDTPSRREIFTCKPASLAAEPACAEQILARLATRAYRRPVAAGSSELAQLLRFYASGREQGGDFDQPAYGPYLYIHRAPPKGVYLVATNYWPSGDKAHTVATLNLALFEGTPNEVRRMVRVPLATPGTYRYHGAVEPNAMIGECYLVVTAIDEREGEVVAETWHAFAVGTRVHGEVVLLPIDVEWDVARVSDEQRSPLHQP